MCTFEFVPFTPTAELLAVVSQNIVNAAVEAIRQDPELPLSALEIEPGLEGTFFFLAYGMPVYQFQIQLSASRILIAKQFCPVEELVRSVDLLGRVANQLFAPSTKHSLTQFEFTRTLYGVHHRFDLEIRVDNSITAPDDEVYNSEIIQRLLDVSEGSIIAGMNAERLDRSDVTISMAKTVGGRPASIWFEVAAPVNVLRKDLSIRASLRRGSEAQASVIAEDYNEFGTVVEEFYRDLFLERFLKPLVHDANISSRRG